MFGKHAEYWLRGGWKDGMNLASRGDSASEALQLASIKKAVSNFVRIVTNESIPVLFSSGKQSYTNRKVVVISASTEEKDFDSIVGLALHEATHVVHDPYITFLQEFADNVTGNGSKSLIPFDIRDKAQKLGYSIREISEFIKYLTNVIEDRRIDAWQYHNAPGYRPYYDSMYARYFLSKEIDKAFKHGMFNTPTVENYRFHIVNMTNRWFDTRSLPDLDLIYGLVDLDNISRLDDDEKGYRYVTKYLAQSKVAGYEFDPDKGPKLYQLALKIADIVYTHSLMKGAQPQAPPMPAPNMMPDPTMEDNLDAPDQVIEVEVKSGSGKGESSEDSFDDDNDSDGGEEEEDSKSNKSDKGDSDEEQDGVGSNSDEADENESAGDGDSSESKSNESGDEDSQESSDSEGDESGDGNDGSTTGSQQGGTSGTSDGRKEKHADKPDHTPGKVNEKKLEKAIKRQLDFLIGDIDKKQLEEGMQEQVNAMEQSGASIQEISLQQYNTSVNKIPVLVMEKLTKQIMESGAFPFTHGGMGEPYSAYKAKSWVTNGTKIQLHEYQPSVRAIAEGFRMGNVLAARLSIRNQNQLQTFNRRQRGKIERRRLHALGANDTNVFFRQRLTAFDPVLVHLTIDASGSMADGGADKWQKSLALGVALAIAADKIDNLDVVVSIRAGTGNYATIAILYDSREDRPIKIRQLFPYICTAGSTPEGLCFEAVMGLLTKEHHGERYFINVSDGMPGHYGYGGYTAYSHTRDQVRHLRLNGLKVLSYFVETQMSESLYYTSKKDTVEAFKTMYGRDASFVNVAQVSSIVSTLNKLFLER